MKSGLWFSFGLVLAGTVAVIVAVRRVFWEP